MLGRHTFHFVKVFRSLSSAVTETIFHGIILLVFKLVKNYAYKRLQISTNILVRYRC